MMTNRDSIFIMLFSMFCFTNIYMMVNYNNTYSTINFNREKLMIKANRCIRLYDLGDVTTSCKAYKTHYTEFDKKRTDYKNMWYSYNILAFASLLAAKAAT